MPWPPRANEPADSPISSDERCQVRPEQAPTRPPCAHLKGTVTGTGKHNVPRIRRERDSPIPHRLSRPEVLEPGPPVMIPSRRRPRRRPSSWASDLADRSEARLVTGSAADHESAFRWRHPSGQGRPLGHTHQEMVFPTGRPSRAPLRLAVWVAVPGPEMLQTWLSRSRSLWWCPYPSPEEPPEVPPPAYCTC